MLEESIVGAIRKKYNREVEADKEWVLAIAVAREELNEAEEKLKEVYDPRKDITIEARLVVKRYSRRKVNIKKLKLNIIKTEADLKKFKIRLGEDKLEFKAKSVEEAIKLISGGKDRKSREIIHLELRDKQYR